MSIERGVNQGREGRGGVINILLGHDVLRDQSTLVCLITNRYHYRQRVDSVDSTRDPHMTLEPVTDSFRRTSFPRTLREKDQIHSFSRDK